MGFGAVLGGSSRYRYIVTYVSESITRLSWILVEIGKVAFVSPYNQPFSTYFRLTRCNISPHFFFFFFSFEFFAPLALKATMPQRYAVVQLFVVGPTE